MTSTEYFIQPQQSTVLSSPCGVFTKVDHIPGNEQYLNERTEIIWCLLSDHSRTEPEISNRRIMGKSLNTWRLDNTLVKELSREKTF